MVEQELPPSSSGSVVLDIGGDIGALVLNTTSGMNGYEIDLNSADGSTATHSEVRPRHLEGGTSYVAVYPELRAGTYTIAGTGQRVVIEGGAVTEVTYGTGADVWPPVGRYRNDAAVRAPQLPLDFPSREA